MKLVVNADDFGLTENVSKAIIEGLKEGFLTSTSAMTCAADFQKSAQTALGQGITHMGVHTTLTVLRPTLPLERVRTLVNEDGRFFGAKEFMMRDVDINECRAELDNQIQILLSTGLILDHLDSHHGLMQKNREFTKMYLDLAEKYQVPLRNEFCRYIGDDHDLIMEELNSRGIRVTDYLYGNRDFSEKGLADLETFLKEYTGKIDSAEYFCHVGYSDDRLRSISSLNDLRETEYHFMRSKEVKDLYRKYEADLITYEGV